MEPPTDLRRSDAPRAGPHAFSIHWVLPDAGPAVFVGRESVSMADPVKSVESEKSRAPAPSTRGVWGLVFSTIFGVAMLTLCLGCGIALYSFRPVLAHSPEAAVRLKDEVLQITVPQLFAPKGTIDWNLAYLLRMRGAYFEHSKADGEIVLLQVDSRFLANPELRDHIRKTLLDKGATGVPLRRDSVSFQDYMIQNKPVQFRFEKGRSATNDKPYYIVDGVVHGKTGEVLIGIRLEADAWDESQMMGMLESIQ